MKSIHQRILDIAAPYLETRHNDLHVREALQLIWKLLEQVQADEDIVIPALILHDVGWKMVPEELHLRAFGPAEFDEGLRRVHEIEGARIARSILAEIGYDQTKIDEITRIIDGHDSRVEAISINDQLVKDCDKLTRFGGQWFDVDSERFNIPPKALAEWLEKQIPRWFFTDVAKHLAAEYLTRKRADIETGTRCPKNESPSETQPV